MRLRTLIGVWVGVSLIGLSGTILIGFDGMLRSGQQEDREIEDTGRLLHVSYGLRSALDRRTLAGNTYVLTHQPDFALRWQLANQAFERALTEAAPLAAEPQTSALIATIEAQNRRYMLKEEPLMRAAAGPASAATFLALQPERDQVIDKIDRLVSDQLANVPRVHASVNLIEQQVEGRLIGLGLLLLSVLIGLAQLLYRRIIAPLTRLDTAARTLGAGDYSVRVPSANRDELGQLGASFNMMAAQVGAMIEAVKRAGRMQAELELAGEVQRRLLPQHTPAFVGLLLAGDCRPAGFVGGDAYQYVLHGEGIDLVVADVSGHGAAAALLMATFTTLLRVFDDGKSPLPELASRLNERICQDVGDSGAFITAVIARITEHGRKLQYVSFGHYAPLRCRDGEVEELPQPEGLPAGMLAGTTYALAEATLRPGDRLLLFTDGYLEARALDGSYFGAARLKAVLRDAQGDPAAVVRELMNACDQFVGGQARDDDQTVLCAVTC